jgi:ribose-phosphate pyrophosphokinase
VDDIIDTAGTLVKNVEALLKAGAIKVYACCTHPVLSGPAVERIQNSELVDVVVTNTIPLHSEARKCKKISMLSVGKLLAQAVQSIHEETSVSVLFI